MIFYKLQYHLLQVNHHYKKGFGKHKTVSFIVLNWFYNYTFAKKIVYKQRPEGPDGWHDEWDVLAGATVSIGSTYLFTSPYMQEYIEIVFSTSNKNYVIAFKYKF